ncbi:MAG: hypothetical protein CL946_04555 [Ectothiorhodospiraceae bacterium]|nr:hypothetical protein [Ectothiorhodospiraceae bacterium]
MGNQVNYTYDGPSNKLATYTDQNGNTQVTNTYTNGKVSSQQDALGNNWSFSYPEIGKCIATDPLTNQHIYVHNEHGTLFDYTDPQGNHVLFDVDEEQRTTTMTNRLGGTRKFTYSNSHEQPLSIEDENGNKTEFTYAFRSHNDLRLFELTNIDLPDGSTRSFTYDANWNLNGATDGEGNTSTFTHNDRGQILTALLPDRGTRTFTYDANRNLSTATDGEGNTTTYTYDGLNRLTSTKLADGNTRQLEYDDAGNVTKWTDEAGNSIGMTYDKTNNLTSITDREGNTHRTEYNAAGLPERLIDAEGNSTTLAYDALKRLASGTDPEGYTERWTYNKLGWLNSYTDQLNRSFTMGYNDEGLPISFANPLGHTTTVARDAVGHTIGVTTPLGLTTTYSRDELGRLTKVESPMGKQVQYGRNLNGWVTSINLPQPGISYGYTYNDAGDVTSATDGLGSAWTYEYNDNGNLIGYTGPTGNRIAFEYDLRQRRTTTTYPGGLGTLTNSYSATGLPIETAYSDGDTWNSTYDKDGRLLTTKGVSNLYDKNGRIISSNGVAMNRDRNGRIFSTLIDGKYTDYKYDGAGNLLEVKDWTDGVTTFVYDAAHRLYSVEYPNSVKMIIGYDNDSRKTGIWYENIGSQQATHSEQVTYNDDGQFVSKNQYFPILHSAINFSLSTAYNQASQRDDATYDALGRLETHSSLTYAYANGTDLVEVNDTQGNGIKNEFDAFGNIVRIANTHDNDEIELGWAFYEGRSSAYKTTTPDVTGLNVLTPDGIPLYLRDRDTGSKLWFYHSNLSGDLRFTTDENANVDATRLLSPYGGFIGDAGSMPVGSPSGPGGSIQVGEWPIFILGSTPIDHRTLQQMIPRTGPPHGNRYSAAGADLLGGRSLFLGESGSYHTYDNFEDIRFASSSQGNSNSYFGLGPGAYSSSSSSSSVGYFDIAGARFKGWKTGIDLGFSSFNESAQGGQPLSKVDYSSDRDPSFAGAGDAYLSDFSTSLGSNKAEFGGSTGLVINAVTKSRIKASPVNRYLDSEQWRYDEPFQVDLRTAYHPELGPPDAEISQNVFNVFNSSTILDSRSSANSSLFGSPVEVLGPRNIRFGGRPRF